MRSLLDGLIHYLQRLQSHVMALILKSDLDAVGQPNVRKCWRRGVMRLGFLTFLCVVLFYLAEQTAKDHTTRKVRDTTRHAVTQLRVDIEREIAKQVERLHGLAAHVRLNPEIDQRAFAQFASFLIADEAAFTRNIAAARDLVISHVYPFEENAQVVGLDYRKTPQQWPMVARTLASNDVTLAGPLELVQGEQGLVVRLPVEAPPQQEQSDGVWGIAAIVIDFDAFLSALGLAEYRDDFSLSIVGPTPKGDARTAFVGGDATIPEPAVTAVAKLPNANWTIRAAPRSGWPAISDYFGTIVIATLLIFLVGLALILVTLRFDYALIKLAQDADRARARANSANQSKSIFLANMSHELRTPLNAVLGYTEVMQHRLFGPIGDEKYERYLDDIHKSGRYLLDLLEDVLDLSRVEAGGHTFNLACVPVLDVLDDTLAVCRSSHVDVAVESDPEITAVADMRALKQVLVNLVGNAIKHGEGAPIRISSATTPAGTVNINIVDYGPGIRADLLPHVTEPFFTGSDCQWTAKSSERGTGVGLALSKSLVNAMGGTLTVKSEWGAWTRVTVQLPECRTPACSTQTEWGVLQRPVPV
jgi:signal transduction histidine kinase